MNTIPTYEDILLEGWEGVYRKSQLSLLLLLALKDGSKHTAQIRQFIVTATDGLQATDDQSIYRALRRYHKADIVAFEEMDSTTGPKKKVYRLTDSGIIVLQKFLQRNVINFFYEPRMRKLIERG